MGGEVPAELESCILRLLRIENAVHDAAFSFFHPSDP